jgi:hypothetical protein
VSSSAQLCCALLAAALFGHNGSVVAQAPDQRKPDGDASSQVASSDLYEQVLDRIFPQPSAGLKDRATIRFALRFHPGLDPANGAESQILVTLPYENVLTEPVGHIRPGETYVEYSWTERRVSTLVEEMLGVNLNTRSDEVARAATVLRKHLWLPGNQALRWQKDLLQAISSSVTSLPATTKKIYETGTSTVFLDNSTYDLWYDGGDFQIQISSLDPRSPLAKWEEKFRLEIIGKTKPQ